MATDISDHPVSARKPFIMIHSILAALIGIAVITGPALAQATADKSATHAAVSSQRTLIQNLPKGQRFTTDGVEYDYLTDVRAIYSTKRQTPEQLLPRVGAQPSDLVKRSGTLMYIRRLGKGALAASPERVNQQTLLPAAVNTRTGQLVVLPGSVIATHKNIEQAQQLAADHGLILSGTVSDLGIAVYDVRPGRDVLAAARALANDGRVTKAEPEVMVAPREPR
jgi:Open reading frame 2 N-terminal domain